MTCPLRLCLELEIYNHNVQCCEDDMIYPIIKSILKDNSSEGGP